MHKITSVLVTKMTRGTGKQQETHLHIRNALVSKMSHTSKPQTIKVKEKKNKTLKKVLSSRKLSNITVIYQHKNFRMQAMDGTSVILYCDLHSHMLLPRQFVCLLWLLTPIWEYCQL